MEFTSELALEIKTRLLESTVERVASIGIPIYADDGETYYYCESEDLFGLPIPFGEKLLFLNLRIPLAYLFSGILDKSIPDRRKLDQELNSILDETEELVREFKSNIHKSDLKLRWAMQEFIAQRHKDGSIMFEYVDSFEDGKCANLEIEQIFGYNVLLKDIEKMFNFKLTAV